MPQPDFSYIRLSHSFAEPLQRKKKIRVLFSILKSQVFYVTATWIMASPEFLFNFLWLSWFLFFYFFHAAASLCHLNWLESWVARQYISRWNSFSWNLFFHFTYSGCFIFVFQTLTTHMWPRCICLPVPTNASVERSFLDYTSESHRLIYSPHPTGCPACLLWRNRADLRVC